MNSIPTAETILPYHWLVSFLIPQVAFELYFRLDDAHWKGYGRLGDNGNPTTYNPSALKVQTAVGQLCGCIEVLCQREREHLCEQTPLASPQGPVILAYMPRGEALTLRNSATHGEAWQCHPRLAWTCPFMRFSSLC